jgi:hypothetical protein
MPGHLVVVLRPRCVNRTGMIRAWLICQGLFSVIFLTAQPTYTIYNQNYAFGPEFMKEPFIISKYDTLFFKVPPDTATVEIDHIVSRDRNMIWVQYKNQGMNDFWAIYCSRFAYDSEDYRKDRLKLIRRFFQDHMIHLYNTVIYFVGIKPFLTLDCGNCYNGMNFLFKINGSQLLSLSNLTHCEFKIIH